MAGSLGELVSCWIAWGGIDARLAPEPSALESGFPANGRAVPSRAPIPRSIAAWEERHGYQLAARACGPGCMLSNGLYRRRAAHPPDLGDRPDDPVRPRARA